MDPRSPSGLSNRKSYPSELSGIPTPMTFHHPEFPHHLSFSQPSYTMTFPQQQFPQQHLYPQHIQYVVVQQQYAPLSAPRPPPPASGVVSTPPPPPPAGAVPLPATQTPLPRAGVIQFMPVSESGTPHSVTGPNEQDIINVDNDRNAERDRTARRLSWTEAEDLRLITAWLNSSRLSNSKKKEVYWANVVGVYNRSTPKDRKRARMQLKYHWQKINKKIAHFYDCWCRVEAKHSDSVQTEKVQLMDKTWAMYNEEAREMYFEEAKHHFAFSHCWKVVWDQPKWKRYISSVCSNKIKLSESGDCTSSSEDAPEIETGEQDSMPAKKKREGKGPSSPSSELQADIQRSGDPQNMVEKSHEEMRDAEFQYSGQKLDQLETVTSEKQTDKLIADTSMLQEFQHGQDGLMADTPRFNKFHHAAPVGEDRPCKEAPEKARTERDGLPEKETNQQQQGSKLFKSKRKRKGSTSTPSSGVQEDIKRAAVLQAMIQKDREKMSEVQLRVSKEKLELARLKEQEAKHRRDTTIYEKYTELLMADTQRFDEFQKEEYRNAVKRMGEMLFGKDKDGEQLSSDRLP